MSLRFGLDSRKKCRCYFDSRSYIVRRMTCVCCRARVRVLALVLPESQPNPFMLGRVLNPASAHSIGPAVVLAAGIGLLPLAVALTGLFRVVPVPLIVGMVYKGALCLYLLPSGCMHYASFMLSQVPVA
jgi:hypothetical protein